MNKNILVTETLTEEKLIKIMTAPDGETNYVSSESKGKIMKEKILQDKAEKNLSTF